MIEDKLDQNQRLRLECLAQANITTRNESTAQIIKTAKQFESYIRTGSESDG